MSTNFERSSSTQSWWAATKPYPCWWHTRECQAPTGHPTLEFLKSILQDLAMTWQPESGAPTIVSTYCWRSSYVGHLPFCCRFVFSYVSMSHPVWHWLQPWDALDPTIWSSPALTSQKIHFRAVQAWPLGATRRRPNSCHFSQPMKRRDDPWLFLFISG